MPTAPDAIGYIAATLTTLSFVPQAWKTFRSRDVAAISLWMYLMFTVGVACWLLYGVLRMDWPIIGANAVTLTLACCVLAMKIRYSGAPARRGVQEITQARSDTGAR